MIYYQKHLANLVSDYKALIDLYEEIVAESEIASSMKDYEKMKQQVEKANDLRRDKIMPLEKKLDLLTNIVKLEVQYVDAS